MKFFKRVMLIALIVSCAVINTSCWNYKDLERLNIVMGFAIDKDTKNNEYILTAEIARPESGQNQAKYMSDIYESRGSTMYEAVRKFIEKAGKKAYWAHANIGILSKNVASEDLSPIFDLFHRDPEVRPDILILVSNKGTAREILETGHKEEEIRITKLLYILENQKSISRYPRTEYNDIIENFESKENAILIPVVDLKQEDSGVVPEVSGSAILKYDRVVGYLTGTETQYALWVMGELKGGLLIVQNVLETDTNISFEIAKNKTKTKSDYTNEELRIKVHVITTVDIGEVAGDIDFLEEENKEKIREYAEKDLKDKLEYIVKKMQNEYKSDIFNFGNKVQTENPKLWKSLKSRWDEEFLSLPVDIKVDLMIKGSAMTKRSLKGE